MSGHRGAALVAVSMLVVAPAAAQAPAASAVAPAQARLAVVGALDSLAVGQRGWCGERVHVEPKAWRSILVDADEAVWLRMVTITTHVDWQRRCQLEHAFMPRAGQRYVARTTANAEECVVELFRLVPGGQPEREPFLDLPTPSCLLK